MPHWSITHRPPGWSRAAPEPGFLPQASPSSLKSHRAFSPKVSIPSKWRFIPRLTSTRPVRSSFSSRPPPRLTWSPAVVAFGRSRATRMGFSVTPRSLAARSPIPSAVLSLSSMTAGSPCATVPRQVRAMCSARPIGRAGCQRSSMRAGSSACSLGSIRSPSA